MDLKFFSKVKEILNEKNMEDIKHSNPYECYIEPVCFDSLREAIINEDISDRYQCLIKGLDSESIRVVSRLINRVRQYQETQRPYFILSKEEYDLYNQIEYWQKNEVVKFEGKYHCYDKYTIQWNSFYENVFYHKHHVGELKNWDKTKDVIDVGAYTGESSLVLSEFLQGGKIYAFEAVKKLYDMADYTLRVNNITNVNLINMALGNKVKEEKIYSCGMKSFINEISEQKNYKTIDNVEIIKCTTLDRFVEENNISVGLIKCDIEGAEQLFLEGAINTIKEQKPAIIISIYHNADDFFGIKPFIESFGCGYKFKIRKGDIKNLGHEIDLIAEVY